MTTLNILELFSGIGGFALGIGQAGVPIVKMVMERLLSDFLYSNDNINSKKRTEVV